ncbi:hypothetical protein LUZ60_003336 [Juncus effusus]|nr:hypothetical protein LUZ60_003336 [Juncus effusus]
MASLLLLLLLSISLPSISSKSEGYISATISTKGLTFAKDLLISQSIDSFEPIQVPDIEKSTRIPLLGEVHVVASDVTIESVNVSGSSVAAGESGITIVASGASAKVRLNWRYWYSSWFVEVSDEGTASVQVEDMEIGLTIGMKSENGALKAYITESGCYITDLNIVTDGGASWFYQMFIDGFGDHIKSSVETAITQKITEVTIKLDSLLQNLPKEVNLNNIASMNVTFVKDPLFKSSSVEFDINGLFVPSEEENRELVSRFSSEDSVSDSSKMLWISLDEAVFNSASDALFQAGLMNWIVDTVPEEFFLNTATWRFLIPQLYKKYPNADMALNISLTSSPVVKITVGKLGASINSDLVINVLDGTETVPVACVAIVVSVSGSAEVAGNNIISKAELNDFSLELKWSNVGNFHMSLIKGTIRLFLKRICIPYLNKYLKEGFPLPIIHGFTLENAYILMPSAKIIVGSDVTFNESVSVDLRASILPQVKEIKYE